MERQRKGTYYTRKRIVGAGLHPGLHAIVISQRRDEMQREPSPLHLEAAAEFFRNEPGFKRLFQMFIQNYQSLGRLGGTARLTKLTQAEKDALGGFFGDDFNKKSSLTISVKRFIKALEKTRFSNLDLKDLLFAYQGENILTKAETEEKYLNTKNDFFSGLLKAFPNENCQAWLKHIIENKAGSRGIHFAYNDNPLLLKKQLENVLQAICKLSSKANNNSAEYYRLPVFAHAVTDDPHAFDLNTSQGRFLLSALNFIRTKHDPNHQIISNPNSEETTELLSYFGIVRDDILNFVTCAGIVACERGLKKSIEWWKECAEEKVVLNVPLREIIKTENFLPANGKKKVFIVENSGVFSEILDRFQNETLPPLICTNGQFKLAALLLFDRLVQNGVTLYYSGDFDPEGLLMAQRLKNRYPSSVKLWHYAVEDYQKSISDVILTENRLNKLKNLDTQKLVDVKDYMLKIKKAGYQERFIEAIFKDISLFVGKNESAT